MPIINLLIARLDRLTGAPQYATGLGGSCARTTTFDEELPAERAIAVGHITIAPGVTGGRVRRAMGSHRPLFGTLRRASTWLLGT